MVCVGGGVGMAPLRAMIHQELARGTGRRIRYFYGARSLADLFYAENSKRSPPPTNGFTWTPALSDPAPGRPLDRARPASSTRPCAPSLPAIRRRRIANTTSAARR
jgi:Na+-transporting NADH:ubiquinone oxidoreductase subunit NqrF